MTKDELKKKILTVLKAFNGREEAIFDTCWKEIAELEQELEQNEKWFVFETEAGNWGMDKATQYTVDRHNYFYGTKNECLIWSIEHKIKDYTGHKYCYDRLDNQLEQAKEIIKLFVQMEYNDFTNGDYSNELSKVLKQAEQFLKQE